LYVIGRIGSFGASEDRVKPDLPDIGLRLHGGMTPRQCVELAEAAEANHLASVWFAENPFERGVLPAAAACAVATQRIRIGVGVWNPYTRHPSLIAMEIGALDELAQGRAVLGLGSGIAAPIAKLGIDNRKPLAALRDTFHIVRGLLRGEQVDYSGPVFSAKAIKLGYAAPRPGIPIVMAARGDKALALCGEVADGLIVSNMCPAAFTARAVALVRQSATAAGRPPPPRVVQYVPCLPRPDGNEAHRAMKAALAPMVKQFWGTGQAVASAKEALGMSGIPEPDLQMAVERMAAGASPEAALDDRFVDAFAIAGTAEACMDHIASYRRAGVTELVLTFFGAQPVADITYLGAALMVR
jgi:5,10-methylenetetrahydromethanopterin reductase